MQKICPKSTRLLRQVGLYSYPFLYGYAQTAFYSYSHQEVPLSGRHRYDPLYIPTLLTLLCTRIAFACVALRLGDEIL